MSTSWLSMKRGIAASVPLALFLAYGAAAQIAPVLRPWLLPETEPVVEPHRMTDYLGRESVAVVVGRVAGYPPTLPATASS